MLWVLGWGGGGESRGKMYTDICIFMPDMLYNVSSLSLGEKSGQNISTCIFKPDNPHLISSKLKSVLVSNVKIVNVIGLNHNLLLIVCRYIILYVYCHRHYHHHHHHCRKDKVHSSLVHACCMLLRLSFWEQIDMSTFSFSTCFIKRGKQCLKTLGILFADSSPIRSNPINFSPLLISSSANRSILTHL